MTILDDLIQAMTRAANDLEFIAKRQIKGKVAEDEPDAGIMVNVQNLWDAINRANAAPSSQIMAQIGEPAPGHHIAGAVAWCHIGGPISMEIRWYKTLDDARSDVHDLAREAANRGGRGYMREDLS